MKFTVSNRFLFRLATVCISLVLVVKQYQSLASLKPVVLNKGGVAHQDDASIITVSSTTTTTTTTYDESTNHNDNTDNISDTESRISDKTNKYKNKMQKKYAFVCVTGVLQDLELEHKMTAIVSPLQNAGYTVDVSFVLQDGNHIKNKTFFFPPYRHPYSFSVPGNYDQGLYYRSTAPNNDTKKNGTTTSFVDAELYRNPLGAIKLKMDKAATDRNNTNTSSSGISSRQLLFANRQELVSYLQPFTTKNSNVTVGEIRIEPPRINLPMNAEYLRELTIRDGTRDVVAANSTQTKTIISYGPFQRIAWRAVNDVRQLESHNQCWEIVSARVAALNNNDNSDHGIQVNDKESLVVRVGDDAILRPDEEKKKDSGEENSAASSSALSSRFGDMIQTATATNDDNSITTIPCQTLRGHENDQIELIPFKLARTYLTLPYARFYEKGLFTKQVATLATYLQFIYNDDASVNGGGGKESSRVISHPSEQHPIPYPLSDKDLVENIKNGNGFVDHNTNTTTKSNKRALVCITGQLERLELENKMKMLFQPMRDDGYDVDVALVLSGGNALFQRHKTPQNMSQASFTDETQVREWLSGHGINLISSNLTYVPNANQPVNPQYWVQKGHSHHIANVTPEVFTEFTERNVVANFKMVESYTHCWKDVVMSSISSSSANDDDKKSKETTTNNNKYDLYVRSRDDVGFDTPVDMKVLYDSGLLGGAARARTIVTANYLDWGGINDRLAFVSADAAECYFNIPYVKFYDGSRLGKAMRNTETYFDISYRRSGCIQNSVKTKAILPRKMFGGEFVDSGQ